MKLHFAMAYGKMFILHEIYDLAGNAASVPWLGEI